MKVALLEAQTTFARSAVEPLAERLCDALREAGHAAARIGIPFRAEDPVTVVDQMLATRLVGIEGVDRVVGLSFPAYFVPHADKVVWILGEFAPQAGCERGFDSAAGAAVRSAVRDADHAFLAEARRVYSRSPTAGALLRDRTGLRSEVLYAPLHDSEMLHCDRYGDYVLARAGGGRDHWLAEVVVALASARTPARCVIGARAAGRAGLTSLRALAGDLGVADRVELLPEPLGASLRARLLAECRGVICSGEEPCPRPVLEAFLSRKPVLVLAASPHGDDGAAPGALAGDAATGGLASSRAELAAAIDELCADEDRARRGGEAGYARAAQLDLSWSAVVAELTR